MGWVLLGTSVALALSHSPWWWILAAGLLIWQANQWHFYHGRPWRKVHYPIMRAYALAAGVETTSANREGRSFDIRLAGGGLLKRLKPDWDDNRVSAFLEEQIHRCESLEDEQLIIQEFRRRNPQLGDSDEREVSELAKQLLNPPDNATIIQFIAAAMIEERYGVQHRAEYLFEVLNGRAN